MFGLIILIGLVLFYNFYWKRRNLPPGPIPWPLFGNIFELENNSPSYYVFQQWTKQYGPVFTYWIGEIPFVAITNFEIIKNTFIKDGEAYAGRDFFNDGFEYLSDYKNGVSGVIRTEGDEWRVLRRFILQAFRDLGMGRNEMQQKIFVEIDTLMDQINNAINDNVMEQDLMLLIDVCVGSIITQIMFGFRLTGKNLGNFFALKKIIDKEMQVASKCFTKLPLLMPWLRHFPVFGTKFAEFDKIVSQQFAFFDQLISNCISKENNDSDNFVGAFLHKIKLNEASESWDETQKYFNINALRAICFEVYGAGQETTSNTLNFLILYLMLNEKIQTKMQDEIKNVVGSENRRILIEDRHLLPYTNAVINEGQRLANLLPQNLPHRTTKDVDVCGYKLQKGTRIIPQISTVLYDEKIFTNPLKFHPERFLDKFGKLKKIDEFVPFSVGKRQCLGESLARMELFLITANLFHSFKILVCNPESPPSLQKITGTTVSPVHYKCKIERRF